MTAVERILAALKEGVPGEAEILGQALRPADATAWFMNRGTYQIYYAAGAAFRPRGVLEIGVRYGYSLRAMILGAKGSVRLAVGFDSGLDDPESQDTTAARMMDLTVKVALPVLDTQTVESLPVTWPVDLAHVDGLHTGEGVYHDCKLVLPHLAPGGVLLIDDCGHDVLDGAKRFCGENGFALEPVPGSVTSLHVATRVGQ